MPRPDALPGDPELLRLAGDLRALRPEPDATFLASLDARVLAGFPTERATPRRRRRTPRWPLLAPSAAVAVAAAALVAVALVLPHGGTGHRDRASVRPAAPSPMPGVSGGAPGDVVAAPGSVPAIGHGTMPQNAVPPIPLPSLPPTAPRRTVRRTVSLTLTPAPGELQDTADGVVRATRDAGGYVQRSRIETGDRRGTASFALRIPSAHLDEALARLARLAHVHALIRSTTDVTATRRRPGPASVAVSIRAMAPPGPADREAAPDRAG